MVESLANSWSLALWLMLGLPGAFSIDSALKGLSPTSSPGPLDLMWWTLSVHFCNGKGGKDNLEYPDWIDSFDYPVFLVSSRWERTDAMLEWVRRRAAAGQNGFVLLVLRTTLQRVGPVRT